METACTHKPTDRGTGPSEEMHAHGFLGQCAFECNRNTFMQSSLQTDRRSS